MPDCTTARNHVEMVPATRVPRNSRMCRRMEFIIKPLITVDVEKVNLTREVVLSVIVHNKHVILCKDQETTPEPSTSSTGITSKVENCICL